VACASLFGQGCGEALDRSESPGAADLTAEKALRAIESCQAQASECFVNQDAAVCEEQVRSCLMSLLPEAGTPPSRPERDGGNPSDDRPADGGKPIPPRDGSPPSNPGSPDASDRILPDAARRALTDPVGNDAGPVVHACINDLRTCIASGIRPSACAEESRACLLALRDGD
jgi:hypothetical protein